MLGEKTNGKVLLGKCTVRAITETTKTQVDSLHDLDILLLRI